MSVGASSADGRPTSGDPSYQVWRDIRERSVVGFVNDVSKALGGEQTAGCARTSTRSCLPTARRLCGGRGRSTPGRCCSTCTGGRGARTKLPGEQPFFDTRSQWDGFQEALRIVRDPSVGLYGKEPLRKIGEAIERRQRPHAERNGWVGQTMREREGRLAGEFGA